MQQIRKRTCDPALGKAALARPAVARRCSGDGGAITAEYAIATLAAVGLAGLLVVILRSDAVRELILSVITQAFGQG